MNPLDGKLRQISLETFESLCQIFPVPDEKETGSLSLPEAVSVDFSGPMKGTFTLCFDDPLRQGVAQAMLEGTPSVQQKEDAMKEVANIICGNILPFVAGPAPVFKLDAPRSQSQPIPTRENSAVSAQIVFPEGSARMSIVLS